ncbi:hypothetical protein Tco_0265555 [Tanacetum coccineum]
MLDDEQGQRQLLAGRVNMLFRDRRAHAHTRLLIETEARMSREAWGRSIDASDLARVEVMSLRTTVHAQMAKITERREEIRELRVADRTRQQQIIQTLTVMQTLQREMIPLQGLDTTLQGQGEHLTKDRPELPEEAGSSSLIDKVMAIIFVLAYYEKWHQNSPQGQHHQQQHSPNLHSTTTTVTNAQLQAMIDQGVSAALAARDATRNGVTAILRERVSVDLNALLESTLTRIS